MQALTEGVFHQLEAVVEVVLERPCGGLMKADRRGHRLLIGEHAEAVGLQARAQFVLGVGYRAECAATGQQQRQRGRGQQAAMGGFDGKTKGLGHRASHGHQLRD